MLILNFIFVSVISPSEIDVLLLANTCAMRFKVKIPLPGLGPAITFTTEKKTQLLYRVCMSKFNKVPKKNLDDISTAFNTLRLDISLSFERMF